jgi:hypothetical protein
MSFTTKLSRLAELPEWLNWLLSLVEPVIVLGIAFCIAYGAWCLVTPELNGRQARIISAIKVLSENWKSAMLLLVLLFYRTIRMFLEQTEEAWGMKRKKTDPIEKQESPNPS